MTISKVIAAVNDRNPNAFSEEMKADILCGLEARLLHEFEGRDTALSYPEALGTPLCLPERFAELYVVYLSAMICFWNREYEEYNNHLVFFGSLLCQYREERNGGKNKRKRFFGIF